MLVGSPPVSTWRTSLILVDRRSSNASLLYQAMWGVQMRLDISFSGLLLKLNGSYSWMSKAALPIQPSIRAFTNATSSTSGPLDTLTKKASGLKSFKSDSLIMCVFSLVNVQCSNIQSLIFTRSVRVSHLFNSPKALSHQGMTGWFHTVRLQWWPLSGSRGHP